MKFKNYEKNKRDSIEEHIWKKQDIERMREKMRIAEAADALREQRRKEEYQQALIQEQVRLQSQRAEVERQMRRMEAERRRKEAADRINERAAAYEDMETALDLIEQLEGKKDDVVPAETTRKTQGATE